MESVLLVYVTILAAVLTAMVFLWVRGDTTTSQKLARVRVRVEERRQDNTPETPEEEFELQPAAAAAWLLAGTLFLLIFFALTH